MRAVAEEAFLAKGTTTSNTNTTTVSGGPHVRWDSPTDLADWCARLSERAFSLQEKAEECTALLDRVQEGLRALRRCAYEGPAMREAVGGLQACVDEMAVAGYAHQDKYVQGLEGRLRAILRARLLAALDAWCRAFAGGEKDNKQRGIAVAAAATSSRGKPRRPSMEAGASRRRRESRGSLASSSRRPEEEGGYEGEEAVEAVKVVPRKCVHEVVLRDQALFLSPPLEAAEARWVAQLHGCVCCVCMCACVHTYTCILGRCIPCSPNSSTHEHRLLAVVCHLPRLKSSRFDAFLLEGPSSSTTTLLMGGSSGSTAEGGASVPGVEEEATFADLPRSLPKEALAKVRKEGREGEHYGLCMYISTCILQPLNTQPIIVRALCMCVFHPPLPQSY